MFGKKKKEDFVKYVPEVKTIEEPIEEIEEVEEPEEQEEVKETEDLDAEEIRLNKELELVNKRIEDIKKSKEAKIEEPKTTINDLLTNFAYRLNRIEHFLRLDY